MSLLDTLTKSLVDTYTKALNEQDRLTLLEALDVVAKDKKYNRFNNIFPKDGEYSFDKYPKHIEFFNAGVKYKERGFIAGNRTGKSEAGAFETTCHATGIYPDWWKGKRFHKPLMIWVGGDTATTCRDIIQNKLLGDIGDFGSGMLPKDSISETKSRRNVPDAIETIRVKHISGGISTIVIKTYEQGRATWQGTEVDFIWIDEECPEDVYGEALIRTMTTGGSTILTFTPLNGLTPLVVNFLDNSQESESKFPKFVANVTWADVPHLKPQDIEQMLAATPPALRDARSKGIPTVGSGLIYPLALDAVVVDDFQIPRHYQRAYGMDVGWNNTAVVFGAWDRENDIMYITSEHKMGGQDNQDMVLIHSSAIKARGTWQRGVIDPAARGRSQVDGQKLFDLYKKSGLKLSIAPNAVEAGLYTVWERLSTGRLKFFKSCSKLGREFALYHRDKDGKIVKREDHLLDSLRYLCMADKSLWQYMQDDISRRGNVIQINTAMNACV